MPECQICRAKYTGRNPSVQCGEGYPWPHHCTVCRRGCGGCNRPKPRWVSRDVWQDQGDLGGEWWSCWELVA